MKSFSDYPRKNRIAIIAGSALILAGAYGLAREYFLVDWWHVVVDRAHYALVACFPFAIIILAACIAGPSGRKAIDEIVHSKAKRPVFASRSDRRVCGICGGFAASRQVDPGFVRLVALLLFVAFPLLAPAAYLMAAAFIEPE